MSSWCWIRVYQKTLSTVIFWLFYCVIEQFHVLWLWNKVYKIIFLFRTDNDSLSDLVTTVEKSSKTNRVVVVDEAFLWRDWKTFLAEDFLPLPGIRKYHYFRFSAMNPGVVFVKETSADEELPISMSRNSTADLSCRRLPQVLVKG